MNFIVAKIELPDGTFRALCEICCSAILVGLTEMDKANATNHLNSISKRWQVMDKKPEPGGTKPFYVVPNTPPEEPN